jgi:thioesterase domain-containing protein
MQAMVRRYIEAMRLVQPKGPYRLGGYCTGGIIAYAMACELVKQGDTVSLLAMIEGEAPNIQQITPPFFNKKRLRIIIDSLPFWWSDYRKLGLQGIRQRFFSKFRSILRSLNHKQDGKVEYQMSDIVLDDPTPLPDYQMKLLLAQLKAITNYQPEPYSGMVTVYNAYYPTISRALRGPVDDTQGWDQLTGGRVQTRVVKSSHRNIHLPPYCDALAQQLQVDLDRSEESCQG